LIHHRGHREHRGKNEKDNAEAQSTQRFAEKRGKAKIEKRNLKSGKEGETHG
jgi:hypothetical protein